MVSSEGFGKEKELLSANETTRRKHAKIPFCANSPHLQTTKNTRK